VPLSVAGESILLSGRIDRIDRNERTGRWAVFDYKTSASPRTPDEVHRGRSEDEWLDLQLPLYRHLLPFLMGPDGGALMGSVAPDRIDLGYILLPRDPERVQAAIAAGQDGRGWTEQDFASADEAAAAVIRFVRSGVVHFDPDSRKSHRGQPTAPLMGALELFGEDASEAEGEDRE
jgi:ATP-dependent helicase/nuclease subunit B